MLRSPAFRARPGGPLTRPRPGGPRAGGLRLASVAVSLLLAGPSAAARPPAWTPRLVIQYLPASDRSQFGAVLVEGGAAWFLGGSNVSAPGPQRPEAVYFGGGSWHRPPLPPGLGSWIASASATSPRDVWAVTHGGAVLRWDGSAWRTVPGGGWARGAQFTGVVALGPRDVWAFGAPGRHPGAGTWHWNGAGWSRAGGAAAGLAQASAASRSDIWAIAYPRSERSALARWDGTAWRRVRPRALAGFRYSSVLALGPASVWVAGTAAGGPELAHYDGRSWAALAMPGTVPATGMCRDGRGGLWVIANTGRSPSAVRHRSASGRWSSALVSSSAVNEVLACAWVPGTTAAWGAGRAAPLPGATGTAAAAYRTG